MKTIWLWKFLWSLVTVAVSAFAPRLGLADVSGGRFEKGK